MKTNRVGAGTQLGRVALLPGDGIGPEVAAEAVKVLDGAGKKFGFMLELTEGLVGGAAIDVTGDPLPEETVKMVLSSDAVLLGSIGGPKWDNLPPEKRPELGGLLALRKKLSLYANLRPVRIWPELADLCPLKEERIADGVDLLTVRELAGGIYFGKPKVLEEGMGLDTMVYREGEVEKIARRAFEAADSRRKKVMSVDKANVLSASMLWRKTVDRVAKDYPDIALSHMYVDNAAMQLILNPGQFDVILTGNLFGDILSDESAALAGSLGMLPSASFGDRIHLFEPAGGSAPDIAGRGIANPIAQILSAAMMLEYSFDRLDAASCIREAVNQCLKKGLRTGDISGPGVVPVSTSRMGEGVTRALESL